MEKKQKPNSIILKVTKSGDVEIHKKTIKIDKPMPKGKQLGGES